MTANQLQAQKNLIDQQIADEQARHNQTVEQEVERSDRAKEDLTKRSNDIQQQMADETERHNRVTENLNSEYNRIYLELQRAQGDQRLELEKEANVIKDKIADEDARHNKEMEALDDRAKDISQQLADEEVRYHDVMESLKKTDQELTIRSQDIQERLNNMQNAYWSGILESQKASRLLEFNKSQDYYKLENERIRVLSGNLELDTKKWEEAERARIKSETIKNRFNTFLPSGSDITGALKLGITLFK